MKTIKILLNKIQEHLEIKENFKKYIKFYLILILGIFIGVIIANNLGENTKVKINEYLQNFIANVKQNKIDYSGLLRNLILKDLKNIIILVLLSLSIFGKIGIIIYLIFKGYNIGFSIVTVISAFGSINGMIFSVILIILEVLAEIPIWFYVINISENVFEMLKEEAYNNKKTLILSFIIKIIISFLLLILISLLNTFVNSNIFLLFKNRF